MEIKPIQICRLIKVADLNHHGTLFAGKGAEWFVEAGFIAAASVTAPENVVCVKIHGMRFKAPVRKGSIILCESKVVHAGRTRLVSYVRIVNKSTAEMIVDGFLTFVHVDLDGRPLPHGIEVEASTAEDNNLQQEARALS
ncbi:MAG: acyl-CoA hydrolase [Sporomusa sp.]|nr:acyl-CoA hydrolase [Sporomusa sp.]